MITTDWTDTLDRLICEAILAGRVSGKLSGKPTEVLESGLAHLFFYDDVVYKLYKTHADKDHFIKGVFAPTVDRSNFLEHDFTLNSHFSGAVYQKLHAVTYVDGEVVVGPYETGYIYGLIEMGRLDPQANLHEKLLQQEELSDEQLYQLGYKTAEAVLTCPITPPEELTWYDIATGRVEMLKQFADWLPERYRDAIYESGVLDELVFHLERYRAEYENISGVDLTVNIDNHDENIFFVNGKPQFIDLLPPMRAWWFGLPYANISNIMINVAALHSDDAAEKILAGYLDYVGLDELPAHSFAFTNAFAHIVSIAHFGSVVGKEVVTDKYIKRLDEVKSWLAV